MAQKLEGTSNNNIHVIIIKKFITPKYLQRYNQMCEQKWKKKMLQVSIKVFQGELVGQGET